MLGSAINLSAFRDLRASVTLVLAVQRELPETPGFRMKYFAKASLLSVHISQKECQERHLYFEVGL